MRKKYIGYYKYSNNDDKHATILNIRVYDDKSITVTRLMFGVECNSFAYNNPAHLRSALKFNQIKFRYLASLHNFLYIC